MPGTRFTDVRHLDEVGSTNRVVLAEAAAGAGEGLVVVADYQRAGRGRLDRRWEAPPGANLLLSVLLRPELPAAELYRCATSVSLAAVTACAAVAGLAVGCKWPNDLVLQDRKLAGVLAETAGVPIGRVPGEAGGGAAAGRSGVQVGLAGGGTAGPGRVAVVVGLGLNVDWPGDGDDVPPDIGGRATSLRAASGRRVDRSELLVALLVDLHARLADLETPGGRERQAGAYRECCTTIGRRVSVELSGAEVRGVARSVDDAGALVVEGDDGRWHSVVVGDVVHVRPADGADDR